MKNNRKIGDSLGSFLRYLRLKFDLSEDSAQQAEVIENISKGVEFRGTNLWVLIFATFVASLGLNVNSTAVIIGAMLISPLMGPIMGIGLSLGINDFELMKRSLRNFLLMITTSILASTLYFLASPLSDAQSELLARTTPTTYDVLIAIFGGLAGIVAQSRKDRTSTVIPGVAIATALMPPLCTAGYGLATGQFAYFIGAFYLFFINTVFIALATYFVVSFLKYEKKAILDPVRQKRVRRYMILIAVVTLVPSVILGIRIIHRTTFETEADRFVASVFQFQKTMVVDHHKTFHYDGENSRIDVLLVGEPLEEDVIENVRQQLKHFGLTKTILEVRQADGSERIDLSHIQKNYAQILDEKNLQIEDLRRRLDQMTVASDTVAVADLSREAGIVIDNIGTMWLSKRLCYNTEGAPTDTMVVCLVKPLDTKRDFDRDKLQKWLNIRTRIDSVRIYIER